MEAIHTEKAPAAIGPYSQATRHGDTLYVSGQLPVVPETGEFNSQDVVEQTRQALTNLKAVVEAAGADMSKVLKTTVLLTDLSKFADVNAAYAEFFKAPFPARACYQVAALPKGAQIEIEAIVALS
ncbi:RidA family protein [Limoniibacter endophyticus]|uniref:RutC family protein y4sK n=1 Tax=Limoniibacter endophyticus TaxID=1565040 RepID=A0A8J3DKF5_9HYPH|nr:RidA family protein [Limoniibacter endophyticus]GHC60570.1 RutC family protein y4sK [Limoniibacter endophyticus]